MRTGCANAIMLGLGAVVLWFTTFALQAFAQEAPDRSNGVQVPLFLLILAAPAVSYVTRRRVVQLPAVLLVVQIVLYVVYETGISIQTNIRIDLPLVYAAMLVNAWMVLQAINGASDDVNATGTDVAPAGRTKCDQCGISYPSHYHLRAAGDVGYICKDCQDKP